tara:strand:+ start:177 stop:482 length:306 start_codon:yes stop_codon:yes gene_type:complete
LLSLHAITFVLGSHFNCPPHLWDGQTAERVYLDYIFVQAAQKEQEKTMKKAERDAKRYNATGNRNKGRPIRTTSDSAELTDFFDRMNENLRTDGDENNGGS